MNANLVRNVAIVIAVFTFGAVAKSVHALIIPNSDCVSGDCGSTNCVGSGTCHFCTGASSSNKTCEPASGKNCTSAGTINCGGIEYTGSCFLGQCSNGGNAQVGCNREKC